MSESKSQPSSAEILKYFFVLGLTGFGGPLAVVAQVQRDFVDRKGWISRSEFQQVLPLIKLLPGPVAFQTVLFFARRLSNRWVASGAGILFLLPAFLMMIGLSQIYDTLIRLEQIKVAFNGIQAAALLLIAIALKDLVGPQFRETKFLSLFLLGLVALVFLRIPEPAVILALGLAAISLKKWRSDMLFAIGPEFYIVCLSAGAFAFGTGLSIVPLLERPLVHEMKLLSQREFLDALAFGQLTPGPVMISITFIAYRIEGFWAAMVATILVFLPSWINMMTWFPRALDWVQRQSWIKSFGTGALAGIASGIVLVLLRAWSGVDYLTWIPVIVLAFAYVRKAIPTWGFILGAGFLNWVIWLAKTALYKDPSL